MRRTREIQRVVAQIRQQQRRGVKIDPVEIEQRFSHLMPELAGRLRILEEIQASARHAEDPAAGPTESATDDSSLNANGPDFEVLSKALPDYDVVERMPDGAQGILYRAVHKPTQRDVALKVLLDGPLATELQQRRFEREIELVARLQHPYIVQLFDRGRVRGRLYFAMEFIDGLPVDDYACAHDLTPRRIARLFGDVAEALHHAHENGIIHRDLKPTNILVDPDGKPHLLDFGLAKDAGMTPDHRHSTLTLAGQVFGTLPYLSPEEVVLEAGGEVDGRCDVYALGVMLYEVLTGIFPYPVTGRRERVRDNILFREPATLRKTLARRGTVARIRPEEIDADLEAIVRKALRKDRSARYASADALAVDLRHYAAGRPVSAAVEGPFEAARRVLRRYRIQVGVSMAFAALAALAGFAWHRAAEEARAAHRNSQIAYSTLQSVVDHIGQGVSPAEANIGSRATLLNSLSLELEALRAQTAGTAMDQSIAAALREEQGDIEALRGHDMAAAAHYEASLVLLPQALHDADKLLREARVRRKLGDVLPDRMEEYNTALQLLEPVLSTSPERWPAQLEKMQVHLGFGRRLFDLDRFEESLHQVRAALEIHCPSGQAADQKLWCQRLRAKARNLQGGVYIQLGQQYLGLEALNVALSIRQQISEEQPGHVGLRKDLLWSYIRLGDAVRDDGQLSQAGVYYTKAIELGAFLHRVDPNLADWAWALWSAHQRQGRLTLRSKDLEHAKQHTLQAWRLANGLVDSDPQSTRWRQLLAYSHLMRGRLANAQAQWADARAQFEQAVVIRRILSDQTPEDHQIAASLASSLDLLARAQTEMGDAQQALACFKEAQLIRGRLYERQPDVTSRALDVISSLVSVASWHLDQRQSESDYRARVLLRQAQEQLEALRLEGRLDAMSGKYVRWMGVIERNLARLAKRDASASARSE